MIGQTISHYRVIEKLGGGGMGVVYKAEDSRLHRFVALKFLPPEVARDPQALARFQREAEAASALNHPNICTIYDIGNQDGQAFIAMEFLEGSTLQHLLKTGKLPLAEMLDHGIQIADALDSAHAKGILHRDIKPGNIFIASRKQAKVLDFGLAKLTADPRLILEVESPTASTLTLDKEHLTRPGTALGTVSYMAPEQALGTELDSRTDLFSLGVVLYEMATGTLPFRGETSHAVFDAILHHDPVDPSQIRAGLPRELGHIILKALEKDRELRYHSAADLRTDLKRLKRDIESGGVNRRKYPTGTAFTASSRWRKIAAIASVVVVLIALGAFWLSLSSQPPKIVGSIQITDDGRPKASPVTDGARIYFEQWDVSGGMALAQVSTRGGETARMNMPWQDLSLLGISPTRSELLVVAGGHLSAGGVVSSEMQLWIVPIPAGPPHRVGDIVAHAACWLPDGLHIIYLNENDIYSVRPDGTELRKLATVPGAYSDFVQSSPDGRRLRFSVKDSNSAVSGLWEISADGRGLHRLTAGCCGSWSPDGRYYYFNHEGHIWTLSERKSMFDLTNRTPVQLTSGEPRFMYPIPSVDGKRLFVMGGQGRGEVMRYDSNAKQFVPFLGGISAREVDVSRDGQWVTYTKDSAVWRSKMDGSERLQLTFAPISGYEPRWSPDGKQIVFTDYPSKIFVVSADGGAPRQLMPEDQPLVAGAATWSPDANSIVFVRSTRIAKSFAIYRLDLKTQQVSQLPGSEGMYSARLSPNGRYVSAFAADGEKLMLYDFRTQTWSELAQGKFSYNNWSRDSNSVYVAQMLGEQRVERVELDRVNIADRKLEHVLSLKDPTTWGSWVSLASDDLPILTRNESTQEIYALDLQLP